MGDTVAIVFEEAEDGLFRPLRLEEEVEGHLRRSREDLSRISLHPVNDDSETLYRIQVADEDDDVAGHSGTGLFFYAKRRPDQPRADEGPQDDEVSGHGIVTPPDAAIP